MLTNEQREILTEIVNTGVSKAGTVLGELVGCRVRMQVPMVGVTDFTNLHNCLGIEISAQLVSVCQQFHGSMDGYALLLLSRESGNALAQRLIGQPVEESAMDVERAEALEEVGNILTNSVLGTVANAVGHRFDYQVPIYREGSLPEIIAFSSCGAECSVSDSQTLYARAHFDFDDERVIGSILILLTTGAFKALLQLVDNLRTKVK